MNQQINQQTNQQINEMELKVRIYESAITLFNEKGIKFTMDDIARSLSISKKTVYLVIKDKEKLLDEMVDYGFDSIKKEEKRVLESDLGLIEKIRQIVIVLPDRYQNIDLRQIRQIKDRYPKIYHKVSVRLETGWEETLKLMQQATEQGLMRPVSLPVLKSVIEGAFEHFLGSSVLSENNITYEEALHSMMDIIINGIINEKKTESGDK